MVPGHLVGMVLEEEIRDSRKVGCTERKGRLLRCGKNEGETRIETILRILSFHKAETQADLTGGITGFKGKWT